MHDHVDACYGIFATYQMTSNLLDKLLVSSQMLAHLSKKLAKLPAYDIDLRVQELLKFLALAGRIEAGPLPISPELDELWHLFILETQEYASICAKLGNFIHHTETDTKPPDEQTQGNADLQFAVFYVQEFNPFSPDICIYWSAIARLMNYFSLDLAGFNRSCAWIDGRT